MLKLTALWMCAYDLHIKIDKSSFVTFVSNCNGNVILRCRKNFFFADSNGDCMVGYSDWDHRAEVVPEIKLCRWTVRVLACCIWFEHCYVLTLSLQFSLANIYRSDYSCRSWEAGHQTAVAAVHEKTEPNNLLLSVHPVVLWAGYYPIALISPCAHT